MIMALDYPTCPGNWLLDKRCVVCIEYSRMHLWSHKLLLLLTVFV